MNPRGSGARARDEPAALQLSAVGPAWFTYRRTVAVWLSAATLTAPALVFAALDAVPQSIILEPAFHVGGPPQVVVEQKERFPIESLNKITIGWSLSRPPHDGTLGTL